MEMILLERLVPELEVNNRKRFKKKKTSIETVRGGAHTYLHVAQIWNGHNSHFRDVTPAGEADRNLDSLHCSNMFVKS